MVDSLSEYDAECVRLSLLFEQMLEGVAYCRMIFDDAGRPDDFVYLSVNPAFGPLTGLSDVVGKPVTEVIPGIKESNPGLFDTYGRVVTTGEPEQFDVELAQLGITLHVSVFRPEPGHFVAVFENITERKMMERQLENLNQFLELRVEERSQDLQEAIRLLKKVQSAQESEAAVYLLKGESLEFVWANEAYLRLLGEDVSLEDVLGKPLEGVSMLGKVRAELLSRVLHEGTPERGEDRFFSAERGSTVHSWWAYRPVAHHVLVVITVFEPSS